MFDRMLSAVGLGSKEPVGSDQAMAETENAPAPATQSLNREQAVMQLQELLWHVPDPDAVLDTVGLPRHELSRLTSDDEIDGALETRLEKVIEMPWRLEGGTDAIQEFITGELERHHERLVRGIWAAVPYGYSVMERVYYRGPDNRIRLDRTVLKPMEWFTPQRDGSLRMQVDYAQEIGGDPVDTYYKFLLTRAHPTYRNPYGEALLSRLYWPWYFRHSSWDFWMQFLERFGTPLLIGKGKNPAELARALSEAVQNAAIGVPNDAEVTIAQASGDGQAFAKVEEALSARIHRRILGQTLTSGTEGGSGNRALGEVHERVAQTKANADARLVRGSLQQVVDALTVLNFGAGTESPDVVMEDDTGLQADRAERDAKLYQAGIRFRPEYVARAYDLEEGEFTIADAGGQGGASRLSANPGGALLAQGQGERFTPGQQAVEDMAKSLAGRTPQPIEPGKIAAAIQDSAGPEDLQERLAELVGDAPPEEMQELFERSLFAAEVLGWTVTEEQGELPGGDE